MAALFAYVHYLAAFTIVSAIAVEFALLQEPLTYARAKTILRMDIAYGVSAAVILVAGLGRVVFFEKGLAYYVHSIPFLIKVSLFLALGIISIYPTVTFLSWRRQMKTGGVPSTSVAVYRRLHLAIGLELVTVAILLVCASLMARGIGQWQ